MGCLLFLKQDTQATVSLTYLFNHMYVESEDMKFENAQLLKNTCIYIHVIQSNRFVITSMELTFFDNSMFFVIF